VAARIVFLFKAKQGYRALFGSVCHISDCFPLAIEAIAGHKTVNQFTVEYGIHPSQVNKWKKHALERLPEVLSDGRGGKNGRQEEIEARLLIEDEITRQSLRHGHP